MTARQRSGNLNVADSNLVQLDLVAVMSILELTYQSNILLKLRKLCLNLALQRESLKSTQTSASGIHEEVSGRDMNITNQREEKTSKPLMNTFSVKKSTIT